MNLSRQRLNDWLDGRPWETFWRCLPALLAAGGALLIFAFVVANGGHQGALRSRYHRTVTDAMEAKKFEVARVACLRGLSLGGDDRARSEWLFYLSIALNGLGRGREAAELLAAAAPADRPGSVQAHLAVAQVLLGSTNVAERAIRLAERQLLHALALEPRSPEVNEMLGRLYLNTRQFSEARKHFVEAYTVKREIALLLAMTCRASGDVPAAKIWASVAIEVLGDKLDRMPLDSPADRIALAQALWIHENYDEALNMLEFGFALNKSHAYEPVIADFCATRAENIPLKSESDVKQRLRLIQKGLSYAPQQPKLWMLLIQISRVPDGYGRRAKELVEQLTTEAKGESAAMWHFLRWTEAREAGDLESARTHLRAAYQLAPHVPEIANDVAMDLAFGAAPDPERALSVIEPAAGRFTGQFPDSPAFRDTRGRILARLGRCKEAVADLEFASARLPKATEARLALAAAYDALGQRDLAEKQRRLARGGG